MVSVYVNDPAGVFMFVEIPAKAFSCNTLMDVGVQSHDTF